VASEECRAVVEVEAPRSVAEAVEVDNAVAPPWLRATCTWDSGIVRCVVRVEGCSDPRRILSLRNTLDDLLLALKAASDAVGQPS